MAEMNEQLIAEMVRQVLKGMAAQPLSQQAAAPSSSSAPAATTAAGGKVTAKDYPLGTNRPDLIRTPTGKTLDELTLDAVMNDTATFKDFTITPQALELQAQVAESAGRVQIGMNMRRAAELTRIPDERVLEMYNALRPHRSTYDELIAMADELQNKYQASACSAHVREAAGVYKRRKLLRGDRPES